MSGLTDILNIIQSHWIISSVVLLATLIYMHYIIYFGEFRKLGLPGPRPIPLFGNMLQTMLDRKNIHKTFDKMVKQYGKMFRIYLLKDLFIVVSDPHTLKTIMVKEFNSFHDRPKSGLKVPEPMASMLTVVVGEKWKNIRSTLSPAFTTGKLKDVMCIMNRAVDTFLQKCKKAAESEETVDVYPWVQGITLETILSAAFGIQSESQTNPDDVVTKYAKQAMAPKQLANLLWIIPFIGKQLMIYYITSKFGFGNIQSVAERMITERRKHGIENDTTKDLLHLMLASQDPERKGYKLTDNEVVAQSMVSLLAGYDTSSITLGLTFYHLAIYPEIQDKLQQEIDRICPDDAVPYESLHEMVYLDAIISETLRLYPPAAMVTRTVSKSCEVDGFQFRENMGVLIPIYTLHHDAKYWNDPYQFIPDRFLPENKDSINPFTYMPFGQGPRNCVGMRFAMLEIKIVIARLLKEFRVERAPELHVPITVSPVFLMKPTDPIYVRFKKRET